MKERPIIMTAESVRAILVGRKTQTRRLVDMREFGQSDTVGYDWTFRDRRARWNDYTTKRLLESKWCRVHVGSRLWVKETWSPVSREHHSVTACPEDGRPRDDGNWWAWYAATDDADGPWTSPLFMPRWASRLTLEVTEVRVQRLLDISEDDARAEGIERDTEPCDHTRLSCEEIGCMGPTYRSAFCERWDEINAKRATWESNPFVWSITFAVSR